MRLWPALGTATTVARSPGAAKVPRPRHYRRRFLLPITVSYDVSRADTNEPSYIRSAFERFGWKRLGGSVFRYEPEYEEDWLNEGVPALMCFRSYVLARGITITAFTLDSHSVARIDTSDPDQTLGYKPEDGENIQLYPPTNNQSSEKRLRRAVQSVIDLFASGQGDEDE